MTLVVGFDPWFLFLSTFPPQIFVRLGRLSSKMDLQSLLSIFEKAILFCFFFWSTNQTCRSTSVFKCCLVNQVTLSKHVSLCVCKYTSVLIFRWVGSGRNWVKQPAVFNPWIATFVHQYDGLATFRVLFLCAFVACLVHFCTQVQQFGHFSNFPAATFFCAFACCTCIFWLTGARVWPVFFNFIEFVVQSCNFPPLGLSNCFACRQKWIVDEIANNH